jgi:hypothetical protein
LQDKDGNTLFYDNRSFKLEQVGGKWQVPATATLLDLKMVAQTRIVAPKNLVYADAIERDGSGSVIRTGHMEVKDGYLWVWNYFIEKRGEVYLTFQSGNDPIVVAAYDLSTSNMLAKGDGTIVSDGAFRGIVQGGSITSPIIKPSLSSKDAFSLIEFTTPSALTLSISLAEAVDNGSVVDRAKRGAIRKTGSGVFLELDFSSGSASFKTEAGGVYHIYFDGYSRISEPYTGDEFYPPNDGK